MSTETTRRKLLALIATGGAVASGACVEFDGEEPDPDPEPEEPDPDPDPDPDPEPEEPDPGLEDPDPGPEEDPTGTITGENIGEYGAEPNPADSSIQAAERNLDAIVEAANAAGSGGTIYVPEGTYYFGHDGSGTDRYLSFGENVPAGVSIRGDGPDVSRLAVTGTVSAAEQSNQSGFVWAEGYHHGEFEIAEIALDGNYENLTGNLSEEGGGSWGIQLNGSGDCHLFKTHVRGWHLAGVRGRDVLRSANWCTFEDNGIGRHNETGGSSISHHVTLYPSEAGFTASRCHFVDTVGSAINVRYGDGTVRLRQCYVEGTGANLCKLSAGGLVEFRNVYHEANTSSLERKVGERVDGANFHGRNFVQSLGERGDDPVRLHTEQVLTRDINDYAIQSRDNYSDGPADISWTGDMVAIQNANRVRNDSVIRNANGGRFADLDLERLSVHDCNGSVFRASSSKGSVGALNRDGNQGLGDHGDITIDSDNAGTAPLRPRVPRKQSVGIDGLDWFRDWVESLRS